MKTYYFLIFLLFSQSTFSQAGKRTIEVVPVLNSAPLELGKKYYVAANQDSVIFETLKFYISKLRFFQGDLLVGTLKKEHLLIDLENPESLLIRELPEISFDKIKFSLGIDSLTSVSGAFGGDLDPTKGMYWTWQSGYINVKIEGIADKCPARNHVFQFHLGGYQAPFNCLQEIELPVGEKEPIPINFSLDKFLSAINLEETYQVMSPNAQAVSLSQRVSSIFYVSK